MLRSMNTLYVTGATAVGGRDGHVESTDGLLKLDLALPKELGGAGAATNPEQLFAAGYAACFEGALRYLARQRKLPLTDARVASRVALLDGGATGFKLDVSLTVTVVGLPQADAEALVHAADAVCPYSNAIRGNVNVAIAVEASGG
jgi:osmotically inducible protein OsmC